LMLTGLLACGGGADNEPSDAALPDADPACHVDCFGYTACEDRIVEQFEGRPIPCDEFEGSCPAPEVIHECERECAVSELGPLADPEELCFQCPGDFVPNPIVPLVEVVVPGMDPTTIIATADFSGSDGGTHELEIFVSQDIRTGTDLDLAVDTVYVRLQFDGRSTPGQDTMLLIAIAGTIRFDRVCGVGLAATLTGASFAETFNGAMLVPDGCMMTVSTAVDIGDPCG